MVSVDGVAWWATAFARDFIVVQIYSLAPKKATSGACKTEIMTCFHTTPPGISSHKTTFIRIDTGYFSGSSML